MKFITTFEVQKQNFNGDNFYNYDDSIESIEVIKTLKLGVEVTNDHGSYLDSDSAIEVVEGIFTTDKGIDLVDGDHSFDTEYCSLLFRGDDGMYMLRIKRIEITF